MVLQGPLVVHEADGAYTQEVLHFLRKGLTRMAEVFQKGTLYLCATPIGNLEDITYRTVRCLTEADIIAAEDTRHTRQLLSAYGIETPLTSYHEHNKGEKGPPVN